MHSGVCRCRRSGSTSCRSKGRVQYESLRTRAAPSGPRRSSCRRVSQRGDASKRPGGCHRRRGPALEVAVPLGFSPRDYMAWNKAEKLWGDLSFAAVRGGSRARQWRWGSSTHSEIAGELAERTTRASHVSRPSPSRRIATVWMKATRRISKALRVINGEMVRRPGAATPEQV